MQTQKSKSVNNNTSKPKLSQFDKALAAAVGDATRDAVNFHHAAGRSVYGSNRDGAVIEVTPPTSELIQKH